MLKKALVALALIMLPVTGAFAQTAGQSVMGFLLMPGDTYNGYTCPSSNVGPCFVQYGDSIPTSGGAGTTDVNVIEIDGNAVNTGTGAAGTGTQRVTTSTDSTIGTVTAVTSITNPVTTNVAAATTGGCTPYHLAGGTAASTNSTNIKASAGTLCHLVAINTTATLYYLRLYNLASAPTCSSATGAVHTYPIPASTTGAGFTIPIGAFGEAYSTGIGFCVTGGGSDTDNTSAATGIYIEGSYK
jgi:hypothetical protein